MTDEAQAAFRALLSRLTWPSSLVREKACREIGELVLSDTFGRVARDLLLDWVKSQELESCACLGILALLRARSLDPDAALPSADVVAQRIRRASILGCRLLQRYGAQLDFDQIQVGNLHSGAVHPGFDAPAFFARYARQFLPPVYFETATYLGRTTSPGFLDQWAFEWSSIIQRLGLPLSTDVFHYWGYGRGPGIRASDCTMGEAYRSAYLRALAWAVDRGGLSRDDASAFALRTCPVDIGLMMVVPQRRPAFWPCPTTTKQPPAVEDAPAQIGEAIRRMWETTQGEAEHEDVIALAAGTTVVGKTTYSLRICGAIQKCIGAGTPEVSEVVEWYLSQSVVGITGMDLLDSASLVAGSSEGDRFSGWGVLPLACQVSLPTVPRWQYWRLYYGIWAPNPRLCAADISIECTTSGLTYTSDSEVAAIWCDWIEVLRERDMRDTPSYNGCSLLLRRELVQRLAQELRGSYCWLVELRAFHRSSRHEEVKEIASYMDFGTQRVVTP